MEWKPEYSIGIEEIDAQHRQLLRLFTRIATLAEEPATSWAELHFSVVELKNFADFHFQFEEALLRLFAFPGRESHHLEHMGFFERIGQVERTSLENDIKRGIVEFLWDWLREHILKSDRCYADHIFGGAPVVRSAAA